jgi:DNA repair exonuclease SbcCD ATPase subunit
MLMKFLIPILIAAGCILSPLFAAEESLEAKLSRAVLTLMDGDEQADQGNTPAAIALYEQALDILLRIQQTDPAFNMNIVEFRIENIEEKLARMAPDTREDAPPRAPEPQPLDPNHYERLYLEARQQALADSQRLLEVERWNLDLQIALREREQTMTRQREEIQEKDRELNRLQREKENRTVEANRELQDLRRFNNLLQDRTNQLELENAGLTESLAEIREREAERGVQVQTFRAELIETEQLLEQVRNESTAEINELRERLSACAGESRERFEKLEEAYQQIETLQAQVAGLPLLEETVIELNRRLNRQTEEIEPLRAAAETVAVQNREITELREMLAVNLERLTETLNELTDARRKLEARDSRIEALREKLAHLENEQTASEEPDPLTSDVSSEEEHAATEEQDELISDAPGVGVPDELVELELESDG